MSPFPYNMSYLLNNSLLFSIHSFAKPYPRPYKMRDFQFKFCIDQSLRSNGSEIGAFDHAVSLNPILDPIKGAIFNANFALINQLNWRTQGGWKGGVPPPVRSFFPLKL